MNLECEFSVPLSKDISFEILTDVLLIAPCIPGVTNIEQTDTRSYKGEATIKLGPVKLVFNGIGKVVDINLETCTVIVAASGTDKKGKGGAEAKVAFTLKDLMDEEKTKVTVNTELTLNGSIAQYGRASGLIEGVAQELTKEFSQNLETVLASEDGSAFNAGEISGIKLLVKAGISKLNFGKKKNSQ